MPYSTEETSWRESIIRDVRRGRITVERAADLLGCTARHVHRLLKILAERGTLTHPGHSAPNKLREETEAAILRIFDANPKRNTQQIVDFLSDEGIETNRMTVWRVLQRSERRPVPRPPEAYRRFEHDAIGSLVYQDTSDHEWVLGSGERVRCIANEDDHSRKLLFARFFRHDGVWENMIALRSVVEHEGLPRAFFVDCASHFSGHQQRSIYATVKHPEAWEIQIRRAVESLGVTLSNSRPYHPQSKGKLERLFGFMQGRLPHELTGSSLADANEKLRAWVRRYNHSHIHSETRMTPQARWARARKDGRSLFVPTPVGERLDDAFSFHDQRTVRKDNTFSYQGQTYQITGKGGWYIGKEVELHVLPPKKIRVFWMKTFVCELPFQGAFDQPID